MTRRLFWVTVGVVVGVLPIAAQDTCPATITVTDLSTICVTVGGLSTQSVGSPAPGETITVLSTTWETTTLNPGLTQSTNVVASQPVLPDSTVTVFSTTTIVSKTITGAGVVGRAQGVIEDLTSLSSSRSSFPAVELELIRSTEATRGIKDEVLGRDINDLVASCPGAERITTTYVSTLTTTFGSSQTSSPKSVSSALESSSTFSSSIVSSSSSLPSAASLSRISLSSSSLSSGSSQETIISRSSSRRVSSRTTAGLSKTSSPLSDVHSSNH